MDCSPAGSSVHGNSQARILEWFAMPFSRGFYKMSKIYWESDHWKQVLRKLNSLPSCSPGEILLSPASFPWASSISIAQELVRNAECQPTPHTHCTWASARCSGPCVICVHVRVEKDCAERSPEHTEGSAGAATLHGLPRPGAWAVQDTTAPKTERTAFHLCQRETVASFPRSTCMTRPQAAWNITSRRKKNRISLVAPC